MWNQDIAFTSLGFADRFCPVIPTQKGGAIQYHRRVCDANHYPATLSAVHSCCARFDRSWIVPTAREHVVGVSHTWDEPEHLAAGLELLDRGRYDYDTQHPPIARVLVALGPYLAGARFWLGSDHGACP
jgi:hypothetical protein